MPEVVLASASPSRAKMLDQAGVKVRVEAAGIDEEQIKASLRAEAATASQAAETLAELKATRISRQHPDALVIGADSIVECDRRWFDKPRDRTQATEQLRALSGRTHDLATSVCVVRNGARLWHHTEIARLTVRPLGESFIEAYLDATGDHVLATVGAYQLEGLGAQLFARVEGDYFSILGLPLLPLLAFLREHGVVLR